MCRVYMFYVLNFLNFTRSVLYNCQIIVKCLCVKNIFQKYFDLYEFPDDNKQEILELMLCSVFCLCSFSWIIFVVEVLQSTGKIFWEHFFDDQVFKLVAVSCFCIIFDSISCNIDEVLSINPSAVFVLGDFDVHHKDCLTYSSGTDTSSELCNNFSISNDLTKMVNFPTCILACDSHSPALFDLFFSSDVSICSTMAFPPLGSSDHVVFSVCIDYSWYLWSNGLVVNPVDSQSRSTVFKTTGWLQDWLSLSSFWGW